MSAAQEGSEGANREAERTAEATSQATASPSEPERTSPLGEPHWLEGADHETREWARQWGHESPMDVVKALRGLERLKGASAKELVKLPHPDDTEGWSEVYSRLGRPTKPDGYELPERTIPEGGVDLRPRLLPKAHELGLTQRQVEGMDAHLQEVFGAVAGEIEQRRQAEFDRLSQEEEQKLQNEWGARFDQNVEEGKRAVRAVARASGIDLNEEALSAMEHAMGTGNLYRFMHGVARVVGGMGEDDFVAGESGSPFALSPQGARAEIGRLKQDEKFQGVLNDKAHPGYREAKERWTSLFKIAYNEEQRGR